MLTFSLSFVWALILQPKWELTFVRVFFSFFWKIDVDVFFHPFRFIFIAAPFVFDFLPVDVVGVSSLLHHFLISQHIFPFSLPKKKWRKKKKSQIQWVLQRGSMGKKYEIVKLITGWTGKMWNIRCAGVMVLSIFRAFFASVLPGRSLSIEN